jgi:hypothetical protein
LPLIGMLFVGVIALYVGLGYALYLIVDAIV